MIYSGEIKPNFTNKEDLIMSKITVNVNGRTIACSGNITINGKTIQEYDQECNNSNTKIVIEGNVNTITCDRSMEVHGIVGNIDCGGNCNIDGDVKGDISVGGSVVCGNVSGDIAAGGGIMCKKL